STRARRRQPSRGRATRSTRSTRAHVASTRVSTSGSKLAGSSPGAPTPPRGGPALQRTPKVLHTRRKGKTRSAPSAPTHSPRMAAASQRALQGTSRQRRAARAQRSADARLVDQARALQIGNELLQIRPKSLGVDGVLTDQGLVHAVQIPVLPEELPDARARRVQAEVLARIHVQQHELTVHELAHGGFRAGEVAPHAVLSLAGPRKLDKARPGAGPC